MTIGRGTGCILPALLLLALWALPASATDVTPPHKIAKLTPLPKKKPARSHTIKIAAMEPLPIGWLVARYTPLILGVGF